MVEVHRRLLVVTFVVLIAFAGCTGAGGGGSEQLAEPQEADTGYDGGSADMAPQQTRTPAQTEAPTSDNGETSGQINYQNRQLIRTGHIVLEVEDFDTAKQSLTATAQAQNGFVSDSSERLHRVDNDTYKTGRVVLRVPQENFDATLEEINGTGTVLEANVNSQDVTEQLVDLTARLENLRSERDRLRQLYEQAEDVEDIIQVERRLSEVQGEIERIEAHKQSLERRVALSTITVELREPRPDPGPFDPDRWYDIPIVTAFFESVNGVVVTLRALSVALAYAAPYLAVFGIPIIGGAVLIRRRLSGKSGEMAGEEPVESETDDKLEEAANESESDAADGEESD